MKFKKTIACIVISIMILAVSNSTFAVTPAKNGLADEKVLAAETEETKEDEEIEDEETEEDEEDLVEAEKEEKNSTEVKTEPNKTPVKKASKDKVINKDVVEAKSEDLKYENITVKGNMFVSNSNKIVFDNVKVDGDVMIFANELEFNDSEVSGSIYIAGEKITISESDLNSAYVAGNTIKIIEDTEIDRELRVAGNSVTINAEIGRDVYVYADTVKFEDEAIVDGKAVVRANSKSISEDSEINELDYEKTNYSSGAITLESTENKVITYLIGKGTEIAIILIITIFLLYGFPKFTEVNSSLRLRDFFKAFFTGIIEFILIIAIAVGLFFTGYCVGYGIVLINLLILFTILGKVIFMISFAIRMSCYPGKISLIKAFFATVLVSVILAGIEMVSLLGTVGFIINAILNIILAFMGLGSMFRVIFTSKRGLKKLSARKLEGKNLNVVEEVPQAVATPQPVVQEEVEKEPESTVQSELQAEVKAEIREEVNELKEEREEEKKPEESSLAEETTEELEEVKEVEEDSKEEPIEKEDEEKDDEIDEEKKEDNEKKNKNDKK